MLAESLKNMINEFLFVNYGIEGELHRLGGENINVSVSSPDGARYVLKIVLGDAAEGAVQMEHRLLEHARKTGFKLELPTIIKTYKGNLYSGIKIHKNSLKIAYLMNCVSGSTIEKTPDISTNLLLDTGWAMARLDQSIEGFDDPCTHLAHQWELPQAGQHRDKIESVKDPDERELVEWAFDLWASVAERLPALPHQVIHGDANKENLLAANGRITGMVDFADACYNPRVCELAVLLAYMVMDQEDPMSAARYVIEGYSGVLELQERELDVLFPLVCGRLAVSVCMASARLSEDPDHPNWFVSLAPALELLGRLRSVGGGASTIPV